jgi:hypothetical protein
MLYRNDCLILARSTLYTIPVHISMATWIAPMAIQAIEKLICGFLWCGSEVAMWGKCVVTWLNAACPKQYDGFGIQNLQLMGFALCFRWLWLARVDFNKTWSEYNFWVDKSLQDFFDASVTMQVGDGSCALCWMDRWLNGCSIHQLALDLWGVVPPRTRKSRTFQDALRGKRGVRNTAFTRTVCGRSIPSPLEHATWLPPFWPAGSARVQGSSPQIHHTMHYSWGGLILSVWTAFGRFGRLEGDASMVALCYMVIVGPLCVIMACGRWMIVRFAYRKLKLWIITLALRI